jgi:glycosyltransferase involved in cell wall biosynthesis
MTGLDVSVVVCAYTDERWEELGQALDSVRIQSLPALELLLVVDHNDELLARAARAWPDVHVMANEGGLGLSGARNTGARAARGAIVAFMDDDAVAAPDWIERLLEHYADDEVAAVGGLVEPAWERSRPRWFPPEFDWVVGCSYVGLPRDAAPVRNAIGANMSFRRDALLAAGEFDERICRVRTLPLGCEETELSIRLRRRDPSAVILYEPGARVRHHVPASRTTWKYFVARCYHEGISKAFVAHVAGVADALRSERAYTSRTLSRAVVRALADAARGDAAAFARAATVVTGVAAAAFGYLRGRAQLRGSGLSHWSGSAPVADPAVTSLP